MHFHLPKPLHGWRALVGEVGIIVVGVLIALGAEQIVVAYQTRADVRAFRETINHEIGLNLFMYDLRARQFGCETQRVRALGKWLDQARSGAPVPPIDPLSPIIITPYRSAWDNRNAEVFNHLPSRIREKYAEFYDELNNNWSIMTSEQQDWGRLASYSEEGPITLADRRAIHPIVGRIASDNLVLASNFRFSRDIADVLKVKAVAPDNTPGDLLGRTGRCPTVIVGSRH
jgi:hypothetical protein